MKVFGFTRVNFSCDRTDCNRTLPSPEVTSVSCVSDGCVPVRVNVLIASPFSYDNDGVASVQTFM